MIYIHQGVVYVVFVTNPVTLFNYNITTRIDIAFHIIITFYGVLLVI